MPRRDLSGERTEQILDAFERCIVRHGLDGSSLELVATEAGVKRSILRHYIGNRNEIVMAMANRAIERNLRSFKARVDGIAEMKRIDGLLKLLFPWHDRFLGFYGEDFNIDT